MKITYTRHAKGRMRWRGITKEEVAKVVMSPERRELLSATRFHYYRHVGRRLIRVTCAREDEKCIIISAVDKTT